MKNKSIFISLLCTILLLVSCSDDDKDKQEKEKEPAIEINEGETQITLPETGTGTATVAFNSDAAWQITTSDTRAVPSWFDVNPKSGGAGAQTVTVSLKEENTGYDDRSGYIKIASGTIEKYITVTQKKKNALLVTQSRYEVDVNGGTIEVEVKANVEFVVDIKNSEWIHRNETRALNTSTLRFKIDASEEADTREGKIVISSGELSETVNVYQAGSEILILTQKEFIVPDGGSTIQIEVRCNTEYSVEMPDVDWIRESTTRAVSAYTRYYEIVPNETYDSRTATLVFCTANEREEVTVTQVQKDALILAKSRYDFEQDGGMLTFEVLHNVDFEVTINDTGKDWVEQITTRGLEATTLQFNIHAFEEAEPREGQITISAGELSETVIVCQAGNDILVLTQKEYIVSDVGANIQVELRSNTEFSVEMPAVDWIKEIATRGVSTHTKTYEISPNETYESRAATLVFSTANKSEEVTITQVQKNALVIAESEYELEWEGGPLSFEVQHNVGFDVTIEDAAKEWIEQITTRGLETTALHFNVAENTGDSERSGKIVISSGELSQTILIKQKGKKTMEQAMEREALIAIYNATGGRNWTNNTNWCSEKPLSEWYGVGVDENGRVTELSLINNNLKGNIPIEIGDLLHLRYLSFYINKLSGIIPAKIGDLLNLEQLILSNNELSGNIPVEIGNLLNLKFLGLQGNNIFGSLPKEIGQLRALEFLHITDIILPAEIDNCINLTQLSVTNCQLPQEICKLSNLTFLHCVALSGSLPANLGNLTRLKHLTIDGSNGLTGSIPSSIGQLTELEHLEFNYCSFSGSLPSEIGRLNNLKELMIVNCGITGTIPTEMGSCNQLAYIDLGQNKLSGTIPEQVGALPNLRYFVLHNNRLSGEIPKSLQQNTTCWDRCWGFIVSKNDFDLDSATINALKFNVLDIDGNRIVAASEYAKNTYTILLQFSPTMDAFANIENLKSIYDTYKNKGIDIIGYSFIGEGHGSSVQLIREYVSRNHIPWRNIPWDRNNSITQYKEDWPYHIYYPYHSYPFITLVDSNGKVVFYSDFEDRNFNGLNKFLDDHLGGGNLPTYYTSTDYSADGKVTTLQKATTGNGIDIVLMGDAFSDRLIADGTYERTMRKAMDYFFTEEPYRSYRNLFNVYAVNVVSENEVYDTYSSTALNGYFGDGTLVGGSDNKCIIYAQKAILDNRLDDALLIIMMNSDNYGGTCYMYYPTSGDYGRGLSVAYFPVGNDDATFEQLLHHEAGGHGFAKLADEYAYEFMGAMPDDIIAENRQLEPFGWWKNADFTNNPAQVKWAKFLADGRYAQDGLGIYEGAFTYWRGAYRPTENSIMRYNVGGFNVPSREAIYYRIHKLAYGAGWAYNYEDFVSYDARNRTSAAVAERRAQASRAAARAGTFKPQTPPVVIRHSWREAK